jgi:hypothetical protein
MFLIVNKIIKRDEKLNLGKQDPILMLPEELALEIFSYLNLATLGTTSCVSKAWKRLANDPFLKKRAIYKEVSVFDNDKWIKYFGEDVVNDEDKKEAIFSVPLNIFKDFERFKRIFPEKTTKDSLMLVRLPKTLNGGLTLKNLGELAKKYFLDSDTGYRFISSNVVDELGNISIQKSCWVLMTKDVLPGSHNKSYSEQQNIVAGLIGYEVPKSLESAACILSQYFDLNIRLFNDHPTIYARCKDKIRGYQLAVGGFESTGLGFFVNDGSKNADAVGIAALRKF